VLASVIDTCLQRHSDCIFLVKAAVNSCWNGVDFNVSVPKQTYIFRPAGTWGSNCSSGGVSGGSVGFVLGVDCAETQVVDAVSSTWSDRFLSVFAFTAFIVKADMRCSVGLDFVPTSEESDSQRLSISCIWGRRGGIQQISLHPKSVFLRTTCRGKTEGCLLATHANRSFIHK